MDEWFIVNDEGPVEDTGYPTREKAEAALDQAIADGVFSEEDELTVSQFEDDEEDWA